MLHRSTGMPRRHRNGLRANGLSLTALFAFALVFMAAWNTGPAHAQTFPGKIGVEEGSRGNGEFVDLGKTLRPFTVLGSGGATNTPIDSNGWPTTDGETVLMDDRPVPAWAPPLDDPAGFQPPESGTYHCSFNGQATLGTSGGSIITFANQVYNSGTNTTTFTITVPSGTWQTGPDLIILDLSNTKRTATSGTNTGITNLTCIRPNYPAGSTQIYTNEFLNAFGPFDHFRVMAWMNTNYNPGYYFDSGHHIFNWSDRALPSDASQGMTVLHVGAPPGAPSWEYIILLANALNKDVWINTPISASGYNTTDTTSYIYQLALLFKNGNAFTGGHGLNPGLHIYLEHSNEVWNFSFGQYVWNVNEAGDAAAGTGPLGPTLIKNDGTTDPQIWAHRRHAERLYEIAKIFQTVFGSGSLNTTIRPIYASWTINAQSYYTDVLNWMNTTYGAPSGYFYAIAGAPYFTDQSAPANATVAQIETAMAASSASNATYVQQLRSAANTFGLKLFSYEGGPDNSDGGSTTNVGNRILTNRDPGMTTLIENDIRNTWFGNGGDSFNYFQLSGAFARFGCWGLNEDITNLNTVKWQAIYNLTGFTQGGPPPTPTGLTATPGNAQVVLAWNSSPGATTYNVYRATTSGGEGATAIASGITITGYTNTGLTNGTTYYYKVSATNSSGTSAQSSEASAIPTSPPAAPTGLTATPGNAQVSLNWTASSGATSYNVKRSTVNGSGYATVGTSTTTSYTDTSTVNGTTYYFVVTAVNGAGESGNSNQASATPTSGIPPTPTGLSATPGNTQVSLSWNSSTGATSYNVKRSTTSGSGYATVSSPTTTSYTDTGLTNGTTYYYVVSAVNAAGESANSGQVSAVPTGGGGSLLASEPFTEATGALNGANGGTGWSGGWSTQNGDVTIPGYNIAGATPLTYSTLSTSGNYCIGGNNFLATGRGLDVSAGGLFGTNGYLASNLIGASSKTLWLSVLMRKDAATEDTNAVMLHAGSTTWNASPALVSIGYFGASSDNGGSRYWTLEIGSTVYRTTVPITVGTAALLVLQINFGPTNTVSLYVNPSSLGGGAPGTATISGTTTSSIAFQAMAYYAGNGTGASSIDEARFGTTYAAVTPSTAGSPPAAPTGLTATGGNTQVALSWTASTGATSYNVKRSTVNGSGYATVASPTVINYTNTGLTNGTTYYYVVTAVNANGESGNSNQASATPQVAAPPAPTNLTATPGNTQVVLNWTASPGATSYTVNFTTGGNYVVAGNPTATTFTHTGLTNGTQYTYYVTATNAGGTSGASNPVNATPAGPPAAPAGLAATPGNAQVALSWTASTGATSYNVKRSTVNGSGYATVSSPTVTNYTNTGLTNGTTYYYVVTAVNANGESGNSNQASATPTASTGTLLASEPFAEATGALNGANGGTGWAAAWVEQNNHNNVPGYNVANTTALTYTGIPTSGNYGVGGYSFEASGRLLNVTAGGPFGSNGYLTGSLIGASGKTIWMSVLMRKDAATEQTNSLTLHPSSSGWWANPALVAVGYFGAPSDNAGNRYWSLQIGSTVYRTTVPITTGATALLVLEVQFGSTNTVSLFVNPASLGGGAPGTASASGTTTTSLAFQGLAYYAGDDINQSSIDELRFGTTYAIVTP